MEDAYVEVLKRGFENELEKIARSLQDIRDEMPFEPHENAALAPAWQDVENNRTTGHKIRAALSTLGGGVTGAGLGAGAGALGAMGLRRLGMPVTPSGGATAGGILGGGLGLGFGGFIGDSHGQSDVNLGNAYERYADLEDQVLGAGQGPARAAQKIQTHGKGSKKEAAILSPQSLASFSTEMQKIGGFTKVAEDLSPEARSKLPKKDFAVSAKKSNTGDKAYPITDSAHARSALGFAKMHGDGADLAAVRAKVKAKFPDMLDGKR